MTSAVRHLTKPCDHKLGAFGYDHWDDVRGVAVEYMRCICGERLSMGHARHDGPHAARVAIEVRAAELATAWQPEGGVRDLITPDERRGWSGWPYRQPKTVAELTGFLAAQIQNHDRDLIDVNWAGHHNADYAIGGDGRPTAGHRLEF